MFVHYYQKKKKKKKIKFVYKVPFAEIFNKITAKGGLILLFIFLYLTF